MARAAHVYGLGSFEHGREVPRARVPLATAIPEATCRQLNLGYRNPASLRPADYAGREHEGILLVPKAGEMLHVLRHPPAWALSESSPFLPPPPTPTPR